MPGRGQALRVNASELRPRLSGLSLFPPNLGFSFPDPEPDEREVARRLLTYLEDRRVLYAPEVLEVPQHCVDSVPEFRRQLTHVLQDLGESSTIGATVRTMRAACRKVMDSLDGPGRLYVPRGAFGDWVFGSALGELRGVMGVAVAAIGGRHGFDVEAPLSSILPLAPSERD